MSKYIAKVTGPSIKGPFGMVVHDVASPADVVDRDGVLVITTLPYPGAPARHNASGTEIRAARKATGPSVIAYPRGGWDRVIVTQLLEEASDDSA